MIDIDKLKAGILKKIDPHGKNKDVVAYVDAETALELIGTVERYREALEFYAQKPKGESGTEWSNSVEMFAASQGEKHDGIADFTAMRIRLRVERQLAEDKLTKADAEIERLKRVIAQECDSYPELFGEGKK